MQKRVELFGVNHKDGFFVGNHTFVDEIASDFECRGSGTLAVSGLQHKKFAFFDGELHILHVSVMLFESVDDILELFVNSGVVFLKFGNGLRSADACDNVFALCVHKVFTEETLFAGSGVSGERNAGAGGVAHVTEDHHLNVDCGAPVAGDIVHAAVVNRAGVVPAAENRFDSAHKLFFGVLREIGTDFGFVFRFELLCKFFEVVCIEFGVEFDAFLFLHLVDESFEVLLADFHNDVGIHLNETTVAVVCETTVVGLDRETFDDFVIETEVEDGVHHTGHGCACTGTDGNEKRIVERTEFFSDDFFQFADVFHDFGLDSVIDFLAVFVVLSAGFGGDGETLRNRHTEFGHFREVGAFTAEQRASVAIGNARFLELINELLHFSLHR